LTGNRELDHSSYSDVGDLQTKGLSMTQRKGLTRRDLLTSAASAAPILASWSGADAATVRPPGPGLRLNVVLFMTDQERAIQHFPAGWEEQNLPGLTRLKRHGLSFERAFTNACMCSPARSTWLTGYFPAQHGVKYTLEEDMPARDYPQVVLPPDLANIATVMTAAGYNVVYKGKWHCSKPNGRHAVRVDLDRYGFARWDPPDAGANQDIDQAGGGNTNNDGRFIYDDGQWQAGKEGALPYLLTAAAEQQPFFLIISLVNPHDVLLYPLTYRDAGYRESDLLGEIGIPLTEGVDDLSTKPLVQSQFLQLSQALGPLPKQEMQLKYINFYGNLMKSSDRYLVAVLDALDALGLRDDTLVIRTADHGEMGLAHGGLRQKNFNFYEEAIRVPLVYSNPQLYPSPVRTDALVSHVDFLPTIADLFGAPPPARARWQGVDYSTLVLDPSAKPVQDYIVFTYDDFQSGQDSPPYPGLKPFPPAPNHIVSIRETRYKLAEYYDVNGVIPSQWEMYDLMTDPLEIRNLAFEGYHRTPDQEREYLRLRAKLRAVQATRLQPLA
jgi:choline-sulfatase